MLYTLWFVIVGALLILMALSGTVVRRLPLSTSMLYLMIGYALGPGAWHLFSVNPIEQSEILEKLTEVAVIISLFAAGLKMRRAFGDDRWLPPLRLASVTMVFTVGLVALLGVLLLKLPLGAAILLGGILAPTDPVLASDVQVESATDKDRLRFSLTGEAGLNDGTAFPFVMLGLGMLGLHDIGQSGWRWFVVDFIWAIASGLTIGWLLGWGIGKLVIHLRQTHYQAIGYEDFLAMGLVALSYGLALSVKGYGFLAVFAAGLALRHYEMLQTGANREPDKVMEAAPEVAGEKLASDPQAGPAYMTHEVLGFSEQMERIGELFVMVLVGAMIIYADLTWRGLLFAGLLMVCVRPLAVYATMWGRGNVPRHRKYIAWFGVRGIGSLYYLFFAIQHGLSEELAPKLITIVLAVITLSVFIHGVTVTPIMKRYTRNRRPKPAQT